MKRAIIYKDVTGYWVVIAIDMKKIISTRCNSELEAYKAANENGYIIQ